VLLNWAAQGYMFDFIQITRARDLSAVLLIGYSAR